MTKYVQISLLSFVLLFLMNNAFAQFAPPTVIDGCISCNPVGHGYGDLDGDGDLDWVIESNFDNKLMWYKNDGQNNFTPAQIIEIYTSSVFNIIGIHDMDGDGARDILLRSSQNPLYYYKNDGTGNFTESVSIEVIEPGVTKIYPFDYEEDGDTDLFTVSPDNQFLLIHLNDGAGNFELEDSFELGFSILKISFVDMDTDGDDDLYISSLSSEDEHYWMEKQANYEYAEVVELPSIDASGNLDFTADYNGDGWLDGVLVSAINGYVRIYFSQGGLIYDTAVSLTEDTYFNNYFSTDYDNDGDIDIVGHYKNQQNVSWFENPGNGEFLPEQSLFDVTETGSVVKFIDLNGDEIVDYVLYRSVGLSLSVQTKNPDGSFYNSNVFRQKIPARHLFFKDFDGDGKEDLMRYNNFSFDGRLSYFSDYRTNNLSNEVIIGEELYPNYVNFFDFADLDKDGDLDMLASYNGNEDLTWYEFTSSGYVAHFVESGEFLQSRFVDFDGDGNLDIVGVISGSQELKVYLGDGSGNMEVGQVILTTASFIRRFEPADLDQDGDMDFIIFSNELYTFENDGNSNFTPTLFGPQDTRIYDYADFNGDGIKDIILAEVQNINNWGGEILILYLGQANGTFAAPVEIHNGSFLFKNLRSEDFDSDGDLDLFALTLGGGLYTMSLLENVGDGNFAEPYYIEFGEMESEAYDFYDFDNDGSKDLCQSEYYRIVSRINLVGKPVIQGRLFEDENLDALFTNGEANLSNIPVFVEPAPVASYSDTDGVYRFFVNPGTYEITVDDAVLDCWELTTDSTSYLVEVTENNYEADTLYFGFNLVSNESAMTSSLVWSPTRCGFTVPFWLNVENIGCKKQATRYALVLDPDVTFVESIPLPMEISGDTLFFETDSLIAGEQRQAKIMLTMPGVQSLGTYINLETLTYLKNENGVDTIIENTNYTSQINCAYDPNDKRVEPSNPSFEENYTLFGEELTYTVRFQNTGTDTAFNIIIRDTLDNNLDWSTFRPLDASHTVQTEINQDNGAVAFHFPNILLPDSIVNEQGSHGYVRYAIFPVEDLSENTVIENTAHIYFDFNPAIVTNTIGSTFVSSFFTFAEVNNPTTCNDSADGRILAQFPFGGDVNYLWSNGEEQVEITDLIPGTYGLTISDNEGMSLVDTSFVIEAPSLLLFEDITTNPEFNGNANGTAAVMGIGGVAPYTYEWSTGETTDNIENLTAGVYNVTLTDAAGCSISTEITITSITGTNDVDYHMEFYVYPNPARDFIHIQLSAISAAEATQLVITDAQGQVLKSFADENLGTEPLLFQIAQPGIYFVLLKVDQLIVGVQRVAVVN